MRHKSLSRVLIAAGAAALALALVWLVLAAQPTRAATTDVPAGGSIQAAIDAAAPGDTIRVAQGTFTESLVITKSLTLLGGFTDFGASTRVQYGTVISPSSRGMAISGIGIAVTVDGFEIKNGSVAGDGAGVFADVANGGWVAIRNNYIHHNTATGGGSGGGIYVLAADRSNAEIADNLVMTNTAHSGGGIEAQLAFSGTLTITGNQIVSNTATAGSGGGFVAALAFFGQFSVDDNTVMSNTATADSGGGFNFAAIGDVHGTFDRNHVTGNSANNGTGGGGVLTIQLDASSSFESNEFRANVAGAAGGLSVQLIMNASLTGDHLVVAGNRATTGDAGGLLIVAQDQAAVTLPNLVITGNRAEHTGGGGSFQIVLGSLDIPNAQVENNHAISVTADGGGLAIMAQFASITATNMAAISNTAGGNGGGILASLITGQMDLSGSRFMTNTAGGAGGGASFSQVVDDGALLLHNTTFISNTAGTDGGGTFIGAIMMGRSRVEINPSRFERNVAQGGAGGGLYVGTAMSPLSITGSGFVYNQASTAGGGMFVGSVQLGGRATIRSNQITSNTTGLGAGGGVFLGSIMMASLDLTDNQISGNTGGTGGGLYLGNASMASTTISGNRILGNRAAMQAGGCWIAAIVGSAFTFEGNWVNDNVADMQGGGCWTQLIPTSGPLFSMNNNQFSGNKAGTDWGGLMLQVAGSGGRVDFRGNQVIGNQAGITATTPTASGGQIGGMQLDVFADTQIDFANNDIRGNTAHSGAVPLSGRTGGMYAQLIGNASLTMRDNAISENTAQENGGGLVVELSGESQATLEHNTIAANTAVSLCGGLSIDGGGNSQYTLRRNRIISNGADTAGGLYIRDLDDTLTGSSENNLVAGNVGSGVYLLDADFHSRNDTIADNGDYGIMMTGTVTSTAWLSNSIAWGHTWSFTTTNPSAFTMVATFSDIEGGWAGAGNINANPLFVGAGDYHLQATSPAVNTVDPAMAPPIDLDGIPRPVPAGGLADMGAYEWRLPGVDLAPNLSATPKPGTQATFVHTIHNTGNAQDIFDLSAVSAHGWAVQVTPAQVTLPADGQTTVTVIVSVPAGLPAGTTDTINVSAASVPNPAVVDGAQDDITVALAPALAFTPNRTAGGLAGTMVVYEHTLTNLGNGADTFQVSAVSSQGWNVTIVPYGVTLAAGGSTTVRVWVTVPAGAPAGTVDVTTVTATSLGDGTVSAAVTDTTTAQGWPYTLYLSFITRNY